MRSHNAKIYYEKQPVEQSLPRPTCCVEGGAGAILVGDLEASETGTNLLGLLTGDIPPILTRCTTI